MHLTFQNGNRLARQFLGTGPSNGPCNALARRIINMYGALKKASAYIVYVHDQKTKKTPYIPLKHSK
jgi:hypothetical protein